MSCAEIDPECRAVSGEVLPPAPTKINLSNAESIRQEMARVYREARSRKLDSAEASRFIYMLSQIAKAHELGEVEKRLTELETLTDQKRKLK